ncbi:response regulator transcription factor [Sphingomonas sp.]|uniref:response regulator transcription factor n=1 Tax=Sphingomonas sp. TaxID=28214 RepID=UPI002DD6B632|nr:response regulator transcription factor [Sphingomonas sp.]
MRILVVEDTRDVGEGIVENIESMGHTVDWAHDGKTGDEWLRESKYQLVVLDLMLPEMDGIILLKRLRERRDDTPVLILTARSGIDDRIGTLDLGADDYLVKPFDFRELQARIRSLLRRHTGERTNELTCGRLVFDRTARTARIDGEVISLTRRELSLLEIFLARQMQVFSKAQLLDQLFGYNAEPTENSIEVTVARLRRKLTGAGVEITTQRGVGYRIVAT